MLQKFTVGKSVWTMYKDFVCISCKISLSLKIIKNKKKVAQLCPGLCNAMDYTVHGFL